MCVCARARVCVCVTDMYYSVKTEVADDSQATTRYKQKYLTCLKIILLKKILL